MSIVHQPRILQCVGLTAAALLVSLALPRLGMAITLGQVDTFATPGDTMNWAEGSASANPPTQNAGVGPDGNAGHLEIGSSGGGGSGSRQLFWNDSQWTGDYTTAGVTSVALSADNRSGNAQQIDLRMALRGPSNDWYISPAFPLADGSGWTDVVFQLASFTHAAGPENGLAATLASVSRVELLSASGIPGTGIAPGVLQGDAIVSDLRVDNIAAIPEPGAIALLALGCAGARLRGRRRRR